MAMFTTIAAGIGLAVTAGTTAMSFAQAGKQRKAMREAERAADTAMQEARKKLDLNAYDQLAVNKEVYRDQREEFGRTAAAAIQAGVESERGAEATAGRVLLASDQVQAGITSAMNQDLQQLEMLSAQEDARNRDIGVQLDLEEVAGAQLAAANAQELAANATAQGMEGLTSLGSQLAEKAPLFEKSASARQIKGMERVGKRQGFDAAGVQGKVASIGKVGDVDFGKVAGMGRADYLEFMEGQDAQTARKIREQLGLQGRGQQFKAVVNPAIQQGKQKLTQNIAAGVDRFKQGNVFLKDFMNINFIDPFRR
jgi:hypothetical protein